jgi:hypothetical protein
MDFSYYSIDARGKQARIFPAGRLWLILIPSINHSLRRLFSRRTVSFSAQRSAATLRFGSLFCIENLSALWSD